MAWRMPMFIWDRPPDSLGADARQELIQQSAGQAIVAAETETAEVQEAHNGRQIVIDAARWISHLRLP